MVIASLRSPLAYAVMWVAGNNEVTGFEWFIVVLAFLVDISSWSQSGRIGRGTT